MSTIYGKVSDLVKHIEEIRKIREVEKIIGHTSLDSVCMYVKETIQIKKQKTYTWRQNR